MPTHNLASQVQKNVTCISGPVFAANCEEWKRSIESSFVGITLNPRWMICTGVQMLIQVQWINNRYDYVRDFMLGSLIEGGWVARFLRGSGWVTVGGDTIRSGTPDPGYKGEERRSFPSF